MNTRKECVICGSKTMGELFTLNMPPFMGVVDRPTNNVLNEMDFTECGDCGNVQIKTILPPEIVYQNNHNIGIIGKIWANHYVEFAKFIEPNIENKVVFEISDPSAKIASRVGELVDKWYIVEPNPDIESHGNIEFIKEFFDVDFKISDTIDTIIHSHFFEHTYDPNEFLGKCNELLVDGGDMFFSIPNLEHLLNNGTSPNGILHFEHTFFYDINKLGAILGGNGFKVVNMVEYEKHSLFFHVVKCENSDTRIINNQVATKFVSSLETHKSKINEINEQIKGKDNVYLYGSHVTSQFYIFNGLDTTNINGILDNSEFKQGKYLFGTNLKVFIPDTIDTSNEIIILCSHMGIYFNEIKDQLMKMNKNIIII